MKKPIKENIEEKCASIWFPESVLDRVDRIAAKGGIKRSELVRNMTLIGVEYLETAEKYGIFQTALVLRDFAEWFRERCDIGFGGDVEKV